VPVSRAPRRGRGTVPLRPIDLRVLPGARAAVEATAAVAEVTTSAMVARMLAWACEHMPADQPAARVPAGAPPRVKLPARVAVDLWKRVVADGAAAGMDASSQARRLLGYAVRHMPRPQASTRPSV